MSRCNAYDGSLVWRYYGSQPCVQPVRPTFREIGTADVDRNRRLNLWKVPRTVFRFTTYFDRLDIELGDTLTITHPRLGLASGSPALVTRIETDFISGRIGIEVLV